MSNSMTAFAQARSNTEWGEISCELRTVNHRYLEISPRLPEELRQFEPRIRDAISERIKRGRADCTMRFQPQVSGSQHLQIDAALVEALIAVAADIRKHRPDVDPLRAVDIMRWPGVIKTPELDAQRLGEATLNILGEAISELVATRRKEGRRLAELVLERVEAAQGVVDQVKAMLPKIREDHRRRLQERVAEVREELDPSRLEQEIVLFLQKIEVAEEIDRLSVHLEEVHSVIGKDQPIGRRLDFLMQELHREANTLGAKSADTEMTQASVELKVLIEQMREQVQNIE